MREAHAIGTGRLGIVGGMGTEATAHFLTTLARRTGASIDQEHIPYLLVSCPEIRDRSAAIIAQDTSVVAKILEKLRDLVRVGCEAVVVPCNTAHYWRTQFASDLKIPLIDMIETTADHVASHGARSVIVLGTHATMQYGIYDSALNARGIDVRRTSETVSKCVIAAISLAKSGRSVEASSRLRLAIGLCRAEPADAIVLACTELPMVWERDSVDIEVVDPDVCLADACIAWWRTRVTGIPWNPETVGRETTDVE